MPRSPEKYFSPALQTRSPLKEKCYNSRTPEQLQERTYTQSASPKYGRRRAGSREPKEGEPRDSPFGLVLPPLGAVRPQLMPAPHALVATTGGRVMCLCGGVIVESGAGGRQAVLCGRRPKTLGCCALSPCGRYLAAGEAPRVRGPQVLVFDRINGGLPASLSGHQNGVQIVAWSPHGQYLVSLGDMDSGHQIILWSWPCGERLASTLCGRVVADLAFAPDADIFTTVGGSILRRWTVSQPQDAFMEIRSKGPPELIGSSIPIEAPGLMRARDRGDEGAAWCVTCGTNGSCYVAVRRGILCALRGDHMDCWVDLGAPANSLSWAQSVCGHTSPEGLVLVALATGALLVVDASSMQVITSVGTQGPDCPAVGISCAPDDKSLWVLYADCSLARWQTLSGNPNKGLLAPFSQLRDARSVPVSGDIEEMEPQVITSTDRGIQLWHLSPAGLACEQTEDLSFVTGEVCALACSSTVAASGHRGGDIRLYHVPSVESHGTLPARHASDVLSLCFSPQVDDGQLLLASASRDRNVMVFRIDLEHVSGKPEHSALLLTIPGHSAAITHLGLALGVDGSEGPRTGLIPADRTVHLAACTADKSLVVREIAMNCNGLMVRRSNQHLSRGKAWVGLCVDHSRPVMYAACADRRIMQLGSLGQIAQQVRLGSAECELQAPLRLSTDGRLLAVGLTGPDMGIGLVETMPVLRTIARLVGHAEASQGIAFLGPQTLLSCSSDGAMLLWRSPTSEELEARGLKTPRPPKIPQNANGILRQLLASSPKPPRWASGRKLRDLAETTGNGAWSGPEKIHTNCMADNGAWDEDGSSSDNFTLGKWSRISKVGAQVRSASDLHKVVRDEESMCILDVAAKPCTILELPFVQADSSAETVEAIAKDGAKERSNLDLPFLPEEGSTDEPESARTHLSTCNAGSNSESETGGQTSAPPTAPELGLQPLRRRLPPVPNFPPPGVRQMPPSTKAICSAVKPSADENVPPPGSYHLRRRESVTSIGCKSSVSAYSVVDPMSRARTLFKDLRKEPASVQMELACLLQENAQPAEEPSPRPPELVVSLKSLRGAAKKLCNDVEKGLQPGPLSEEVLPLLRRVHGVLHHNEVHCTIASLTGNAC
eukprot:gnl/MRDRNA2_/MRDRNA2_27659_c0_seq1.p1 gnl/MRDRNA2_/MRDRNA2_27659_c0~~gnl/MRDRNA2_/MRDRNA2_27659_c0_seq1.p1  ORF type:complete len:1116 (+),score=179.44 gnl/MRDRNA2_/MRDRNA2_27659_c0_seq1:66-3413(+)